MKTQIQVFKDLKKVVKLFLKSFNLHYKQTNKGRKLSMSIADIISLALLKQYVNIATKKELYRLFKNNLNCSYKTFVVNINRFSKVGLMILALLMKINKANQHIIKHIDSTEIPVCLFKNSKRHKVMKCLANYSHSSKGIFYGLKLHLVSDLNKNILSIKITSGNVNDRDIVFSLTKDMNGIFIADAGYISKGLQEKFHIENKRTIFIIPRINMKKIMTKFEEMLIKTRMLIELNFRNLKMFCGLVTSLPRSIDGYFANYIYSIFACMVKKQY